MVPKKKVTKGGVKNVKHVQEKVADAVENGPELMIKKKKKKSRDYSSLALYNSQMLKQIDPTMGIGGGAPNVLQSIVDITLHKLCTAAKQLIDANDKHVTMMPNDVLCAAKIIFPEELCKFLTEGACEALDNYRENTGKGK